MIDNKNFAVPPEVEDALFQRLLRRLQGGAATVGGGIAGGAATVRQGASDAAEAVARAAVSAGSFVKENPVALAPLAIVPGMAPLAIAAVSALAAKQIVEARNKDGEKPAQVLFRVPPPLRDRLKELAEARGVTMDALLIEATLDVLAKHDRLRLAPPESP